MAKLSSTKGVSKYGKVVDQFAGRKYPTRTSTKLHYAVNQATTKE
jgi:hypothetical protein